jgi:hypothetical protein
MLKVVVLGLLLLFITACGSTVGGCYPCADTQCDCTGNGYGGPYNPKALDLYRPGRFEDMDSPGF